MYILTANMEYNGNCGRYFSGNPLDGFDFDCFYNPPFECEDCIYWPFKEGYDPEDTTEWEDWMINQVNKNDY